MRPLLLSLAPCILHTTYPCFSSKANQPGASRREVGRKLAARADVSGQDDPNPQRSEAEAALSFLSGLDGIESAVRGDLALDNEATSHGRDDVVEELAAMIERGEELPADVSSGLGPGRLRSGHVGPLESAESFIGRLEAGLAAFQDVVAGRLKVGNVLPGPSTEDSALDGVFTDLPGDRSTLPPNIPEHAMAMYKFGERVLYILRRGYQSQSLSKPLELLDSYGLLEDNLKLTTQLLSASGGVPTGKAAIMRHCGILDRLAVHVQCCNLLVAFPQLRDPGQFRSQDDSRVAKATCDIIIFIPVPYFYSGYLASRGEEYNDVTIEEQIRRGIHVPESPNQTSWRRKGVDAHTTTISDLREAHRALLSENANVLEAEWLPQPNARGAPLAGPLDEDSSDELSPDDAEGILRTLLGEDFDKIAQQLPRRRRTPPHVDPEYACVFDDSAREKRQLRLATTWTFDVDLEERRVTALQVDLSWVNGGLVKERDLGDLLWFLLSSKDM
jgi:hypothetical protein